MGAFRVEVTDDPEKALRATKTFLRTDPIAHNLVLTLLHARTVQPMDGQYAWVARDDDVVGVLFRSPLDFPAPTITPVPREAIAPFVEGLADAAPDLPGVMGDAATAAGFAGAWATALKTPAVTTEGQRLYELTTLEPPEAIGELRQGTPGDFDLTMAWLEAFGHETGAHAADPDAVTWRLTNGSMYFWERDGQPVSLAGHSLEVGGVTRVGPVYTPDEHRRNGYGAAVTSGVTRAALDKGARTTCLYTQLSNPQSNAIYRRLGYRPVAELIGYRFGST